jgi:hypothetical protein
MIIKAARFLFHATKENGPAWVAKRAAIEAERKSGVITLRCPRRPWRENELAGQLNPEVPQDPEKFLPRWRANGARFFIGPKDREKYAPHLQKILGKKGIEALAAKANAIAQGRFEYFSSRTGSLGMPPDWHLDPFTGEKSPRDVHWSKIPISSALVRDLKYVWEPSRFAWAYTLARAYWATGDARHAETFFSLVLDWGEANPPNTGANWGCGQEISLRLMAWAFALHVMQDAPAAAPARVCRVLGMMAAQAERVSQTTLFAHLQKNNHAVSEGVGLYLAGTLLSCCAKGPAWKAMGKRILEEEALLLINPDGSFNQKSMNYHRVMLEDYLYALALARANGDLFAPSMLERVKAAAGFLRGMMDASGGAPNLGGNDGALVLPLSQCAYPDYRPACYSGHYAFHGTRLATKGPWDEHLLWLFGPKALTAKRERSPAGEISAPRGGCHTLRGARAWAMIRCGTFEDRPSHADSLHLDIWRDGVNIAMDPGSYSYYAPPPWNNALAGTAVHNTVCVDGLDQMERGPRFMWTRWLKARVHENSGGADGKARVFSGGHNGYARLPEPVFHNRSVVMAGEDVFFIVDDLVGRGSHTLTVHWLLADLPWRELPEGVELETPTGLYAVRARLLLPSFGTLSVRAFRGAESTAPFGWSSPRYGEREPGIALVATLREELPCRVATLFAPAGVAWEMVTA